MTASGRYGSRGKGHLMATNATFFPHRLRLDGTYDSICTGCFRTIGTSEIEAELLEAEKSHICNGLNLESMFHPPNVK